jgi:uncharacterized UBP type Zn finger protein
VLSLRPALFPHALVGARQRNRLNFGIRHAILGKRSHAAKEQSTGEVTVNGCTHTNQIRDVKPHSRGCEDCLKIGDTWVHLRLCMRCGHVGCCDSSKNKHATKHFHSTKHPIVKSIEPGEDWGWCYVDEVVLEPI